MQQIPKRKSKLVKKIFSYFLIGVLCFYIYYVFLRNKENKLPEGIFQEVFKVNQTLYIEQYYDGYTSEVYLTDSVNFRLFIMSYIFEHQQFFKFTIDKTSITFISLDKDYPIFNNMIAKSYTFEELKTKNNLRK